MCPGFAPISTGLSLTVPIGRLQAYHSILDSCQPSVELKASCEGLPGPVTLHSLSAELPVARTHAHHPGKPSHSGTGHRAHPLCFLSADNVVLKDFLFCFLSFLLFQSRLIGDYKHTVIFVPVLNIKTKSSLCLSTPPTEQV